MAACILLRMRCFIYWLYGVATADFKSVVLFKFAHAPKSICISSSFKRMRKISRTTDLKTGVQGFADFLPYKFSRMRIMLSLWDMRVALHDLL